MEINSYYDPAYAASLADGKTHRSAIGGLWEPMGILQRDFLIQQGLKPGDRLLDIGCGSLRLGTKVVDYLEPGNYFGCDLVEAVLDAGYRCELTDEQRIRLPRTNLWATDNFDFTPLKAPVEAAIAQSLFSHLPPAFLRLCLAQLERHMVPGGSLFATFFLAKPRHPIAAPCVHPASDGLEPIRTTALSDPYHYWVGDLRHAARQMPWEVEVIGNWNHPRGQQMVRFRRTDRPAAGPASV